MSGRYGAGVQVAGVNAANTVAAQLRATTAAERLYIVEIAVGVVTAPTTAPSFYLTRPSAVGTNSATLLGIAQDPSETAAIGSVDSAFSVAPTITATAQMRRRGLSVTAGGQLIWTFYDSPLIVAGSAALAVVNAIATGATLGAFTVDFVWDE